MIDDKRPYGVLEYAKVLNGLAARASSALAAEEARSLEPSNDIAIVRERLAETSEAYAVIMRKGALSLGEFGDIASAVSYAEKGGVLSMGQLLDVARQLGAARRAISFLRSDVPDIPMLSGLLSVMETNKPLEDRIVASIISETEMSDAAGPELRRIRRRIAIQNDNIREKLNKMITSSAYRDLLRDPLVTLRDGRFCLPVRQECQQRFPGIVHDRSKGGATVFIEPQAIVDLNNGLRELELDEEREIERILWELSALVGAMAEALRINQRMLVHLDLIFAKALLSSDMRGTEPELNEGERLEIAEGRHPLIDAQVAVPISLSLGGAYRTLIITGPNTGGKTVTLKTVGLFILMAEAGLHLPASRASIPVVSDIYADIGDEQSIEQSLSTFSSHMKHIVEIVADADRDSVVFLDELGAGTDPTEGAALAISVLETLRAKGCMIMATTHYTEIKKYAVTTDGVENASMEFDVETLSPTFRLTLGMPGRSNAFEISRKLGLPEPLVDRAAALLDSGSIAFETVLARAEADRRAAQEDRLEAEALRAELERRRAELERRVADLENERAEILRKAKDAAAETIAEAEDYAAIARDELKSLIDEAKHIGAGSGRATETSDRGDLYRRMDGNRKTLARLKSGYRAGDRVSARARENPQGGALRAQDVRIGDHVRLLDFDAEGEVLTAPDEKGDVQVRVGRIRMTAPISNLRSAGGGGKKESAQGYRHGTIVRAKMDSIGMSVDVHGQNLDEAERTVDKYLDDAFLAGLREVNVIHGKGEGILRNGLRRMLKQHRHVRSSRPGGPGEGGDGTTIVTLK
ncbi:MAG: endonuclease MutS2 [Clostridiales Family XIII bacterium]|jgi:DNA mismatch repair protein MutS2|nr:endonuclease MutS2 [Clostridiales Family XIII bacterium]